MRTSFTSQNMTGPFASVTRNSFRCSLLVLPQTLFLILYILLQYYTDLFKYMYLCYALTAFSQLCHMLPGFAQSQVSRVKAQLPDVQQGFTDNIARNVHLIYLSPLYTFLLFSQHYMQTLQCRRQCFLTVLINTSPPPQIFSQPL